MKTIHDLLTALKQRQASGTHTKTIFLGADRVEWIKKFGALHSSEVVITHVDGLQFNGIPVKTGDYPSNYIGFN